MTSFWAASGTAQESLHRHAESFLSIFQQAGISMARLDSDLCLLEANSDFVRWFGGSPSALRGRPFLDFLHPSTGPGVREQLSKVAAGSRVRLGDRGVALRADGSPLPVELTLIGVRDGVTPGASEIIVLVAPEKEPSESLGRQRVRVPNTTAPMTLTEMEARILEQLATGISTRKLALRLHLSRQGVEYHIGAMLRKAGVPNRTALVSRAHSLGIFSGGHWPPRIATDFVSPPQPRTVAESEKDERDLQRSEAEPDMSDGATEAPGTDDLTGPRAA
ncbi:LuxR C-terminal-related transcriptional regulator [Streptomyces graminofaciens]|nr:LuxR C-terminal-related transcriptional regulator [Streptomyces graminofaciens]